jgi:hypothetical protein
MAMIVNSLLPAALLAKYSVHMAMIVTSLLPAALLAQHVLCPGGHDNDLGPGGGDAHLHAAVPILRQLTGQQLVQLSLEVVQILKHFIKNLTISGYRYHKSKTSLSIIVMNNLYYVKKLNISWQLVF